SARPERKMESAAERRLFWGTAAAIVVADFATKLIAETFLARRLPLSVLDDVVQLRLVYNEGAAFGLHLGDNSRWIFLGLALIALVVLASLVRGTRAGRSTGRRRRAPQNLEHHFLCRRLHRTFRSIPR